MKPKHVEAERLNARETLRSLRIQVGQDFHTLAASKPRGANGSRARYFHDLLRRRAN